MEIESYTHTQWPEDLIQQKSRLTMPPHERNYASYLLPGNQKLECLGPDLDAGPLPAVFYFALSGQDSLLKDPYNQCVTPLPLDKIRCFSLSLPGHQISSQYAKGIAFWATCFAAGQNIIFDFLSEASGAIDFLEAKGAVQPNRITAAGLSRGAFIAAHLAANDPRISSLLGFSPLTRLDKSPDFIELKEEASVASLNLINIASQLARIPVKFFIGNRDVRVGTKNCFDFIYSLADAAFEQGIRTPPVELFIYPSVGFQGHGTPPNIFLAGANWIKTLMQLD